MFSRFLSINPPEPELLFDVKREHKANSDYPEGYPSLHDFSHNNCFATYQSGNLKSPELYYNRWNFTAGRCEATQLATGVYHVTKLTPPTTNSFNSILFSCSVNSFKGVGNKFGIYVSKPEGRDFDSSALFYNGSDDTGELFFTQSVVEGMNIIDLSEVHENPNSFWRLKIPNSFYNRDESGGLLYTETDFYVIFFPVLDESQCNGYGEYLCPKFDNSVWTKNSENIVISEDGLTVDSTSAEHYYDICYVPQPYYEDNYIAVYSPEFLNISCAENRNIIAEPRGVKDQTSEIVGTNQSIGRTTGTNSPFYGGVIFKESYDSVYLQFYFSAKGVFTMLPYNNDRFTVLYSGNNTNVASIQVSETVPFHDKCELQTLITKYRNTYKGSSILYRNEVVTTSEDLLGIYGFRLNTYAEDSTNYSHRHCIIDAAQGRWENLVSYCNNTIVTNQITDYELLYKDTVSAVVLLNKEVTSEDCSDTGSKLFSNRGRINCFSGQFYYLIGFKERLTPWQIAWVLSHLV